MDRGNEAPSLNTVRDALRAELTARGLDVSSDSHGLRRELYVLGDNDLARALFHFDTDAQDASESIYRSSGSWVAGMPPRFVVLPSSETGSQAIEMLEQIHTTPLFYDVSEDGVAFRDLEAVIAEVLA